MRTEETSLLPRDSRVLGVDPSFNRTGWALLTRDSEGTPLLVACGVIAPTGDSRSRQLGGIQQRFDGVLAEYSPGCVYFERPGNWQRRGGSRTETIEVMAMARGVMLAACAQRSLPASEIDFHTVRGTLIGNRNANADRVLDFVRGLGFDLPTRPRGGIDIDIINAIVVAVHGVSQMPWQSEAFGCF